MNTPLKFFRVRILCLFWLLFFVTPTAAQDKSTVGESVGLLHCPPLAGQTTAINQIVYHLVDREDTLGRIAISYYGDFSKYLELVNNHNANREKLRRQLTSENIPASLVHGHIDNVDLIDTGRYIYLGEEYAVRPTDRPIFRGKVRISGSSTVYPIVHIAARCFERSREFVENSVIDTISSGSTAGLRDIQQITPQSDIAAVSNKNLLEDATNPDLVGFPIAKDTVSFVVQPGLFVDSPSIDISGLRQLLTTSKTWDDVSELILELNPNLKNIGVYRFYPSQDSGTLSFVASVIQVDLNLILDAARLNGAPAANCATSTTHNVTEKDQCLVRQITNSQRSINNLTSPSWKAPNFGFVGSAYAKGLSKESLLSIRLDNGIVRADNPRYPFQRELYLISTEDILRKNDGACEFLHYIISNANFFATAVGCEGLPLNRLSISKRNLRRFYDR